MAMPTAWRNRIVGQGEESPDQLVANPLNWRTHPGPQRDALRGSLSEVGWVQQVLVNKRTGNVVDGHARVEEALSRHEATVPVLYVDLEPDEERLVLASLDPIGAMAQQDDERLRELLADLSVDDVGLQALLDSLSPDDPKAGLTDPDDVPDLGEETHIKRGDLFTLGDHRLMCGDATDAGDVGRLLGDGVPRLLVTDPPYGVELDMEWRDRAGHNEMAPAARSYMKRSIAVDQETRGGPAISGDTVADWSGAYALVPSLEVAYVWHATSHMIEVAHGLEELGFDLRQQIVWVKTVAAMSRSAYNWQHEPCWYAVRKGKTAEWLGGHSESTVWEMASPKHIMSGSKEQKFDHPTQKPAEAMARPIRNHKGDVYEPFSGSGTTVIAAEQLNRRCYAMEIDPRYVAVAIERWEKFTGKTSERIDGG